MRPEEAVISVFPDGTSWVCDVVWPDGMTVTRTLEFSLHGYPEILLTEGTSALEALEDSVRRDPAAWRP